MSSLYIPNSIALRNFDSLFVKNTFLFNDGNVDISFHPKYIAMHPVALAFYAALADYFQINNIPTTASINPAIRSIAYLQRMGLFRVLGFNDPVQTKTHEETGRFIPLLKIQNSADLDAFLKTIDPILHTNRENTYIIKHVFSELLRNVLEHSNSSLGGNVCATYNHRRQKISIGISDAGRGIFNSIVRSHPVRNHKEAILASLKPGISGTTSRLGGTYENAGAGLFITKCIAQSTRNHFLIYSGNSYFKLNLTPHTTTITFNPDPMEDRKSIKEGLPLFNGTVVGIDIHIEDSEAFNKLMDSIGDAYKLGVKQSKKDYYRRIRFT